MTPRKVRDLASEVYAGLNALHIAMSSNVDKSSTLTLTLNEPFTIVDQSKMCVATDSLPAREIGVRVDVDAKGRAQVDYGVAAVGSIIPPVRLFLFCPSRRNIYHCRTQAIDDFGIFVNLDAQLDGMFNIDASANVSPFKLSLLSHAQERLAHREFRQSSLVPS